MALNLYRKSPEPLVVFDRNQDVLTQFVQEATASTDGARLTVAKSLSQVAAQVSTIITMLPASHHVEQVYLGTDGLVQCLEKGATVVDCSTIDPQMTHKVAKAVEAREADCVDAPVSGGVMGAEAGTLTFMAGASRPEVLDRVRPWLDRMGKNVVYCGDHGSGQVVKICNNMLLGICMIGTAETMRLGQQLGVDPKLLASVINTSSGRCWASEISNPCPGVVPTAPASRDYEGGFGMPLMLKDMGLAIKAASDSQVPINLASLSHSLYQQALENPEFRTKDFGAIFKWLKDHSSASKN
ncbi:hypothetical protein H4R34_000720 [Dimargaris verticillata]|uniref:3-hydroxyisobutyrate dehydrogenase n=1 Tax=Dimargaris verticillata TaxID=2761393 RepID=A0A9W8BCS7_9FUNG|nr:hypothetical protein H4R34_000720 [Dimargaris verticillata]